MTNINEYIYMKVTKDKFELPLEIADSAIEMSKITGLEPATIYKNVYRNEKLNKRSGFVRVKINE